MALLPVWICNGIVARRQMELYFLRSVLFYSDSAGDCRAAGKGPGAEYLSYPGGFPGVAESSDHKNMGHYFCRRAVLPGGMDSGQGCICSRSIFEDFQIRQLWDGTLLELGLQQSDIAVVVAGCIVAAAVGMIKRARHMCERTACRVPASGALVCILCADSGGDHICGIRGRLSES